MFTAVLLILDCLSLSLFALFFINSDQHSTISIANILLHFFLEKIMCKYISNNKNYYKN